MQTSSSNFEAALLTQVIFRGDFHSLEKFRVSEKLFRIELNQQIYRYLRSVYFDPATRGIVPSPEMTRTRFPNFVYFPSNDEIPVLIAELKRENMRMELLKIANGLDLNAPIDPLETFAKLRSEVSDLSQLVEMGADLSLASSAHMLRERYDTVADAGGVIGIPYPWDVLNEETQGLQGSQFVVLFGRPKSMKTWVGISMAVYAYLTARKRVLFYTREMSPEMIMGRVAARVTRVDYKKFRNGKLQPDLRDRTFEILEQLVEADTAAAGYGLTQPCFEVVSDRSAGGSGGGVGWLQAKIRDIKPDIVFVDGMYLMKDDRSNQRSIDWKQIAHISQDLKLTAQEFDIPVVGITQANRAADKSKGVDLTELAFSDSLGQDADAVFRVSKKDVVDEATSTKHTELWLTAPGLREGTFDGIVLRAHPATHFEYLRTLHPGETESKPEPSGNGGNSGGGGNGGGSGTRRSTFRRTEPVPPIAPMRM